jgi:predicted DsbA family dithiol-disulfide isomerase
MTSLSVDIVSDPVCPWCYVGKRRLEQALAQRPDLAVSVNWLPFQLSPDMPREGKDRMAHFESIFGAQRARTILESMSDTGQDVGLKFQLKPGARSPNTLAAHMLIYRAGQVDGIDQNELTEKLFAAHHTECDDLGDPAVLARIAGEVGLDSAREQADLEARIYEDQVLALIEQAKAAGVSGVPFFIFNQRLALSGAQPPDVLLQAIDQATA